MEFELLQGWRAADSILLFNIALENLAVFDRCRLLGEYQRSPTGCRIVQVNRIDRQFSMATDAGVMFDHSARSRRPHLHRWSQLGQYPVVGDGAARCRRWSHAYGFPALTMNFPVKKKNNERSTVSTGRSQDLGALLPTCVRRNISILVRQEPQTRMWNEWNETRAEVEEGRRTDAAAATTDDGTYAHRTTTMLKRKKFSFSLFFSLESIFNKKRKKKKKKKKKECQSAVIAIAFLFHASSDFCYDHF